MTVTVKFPINSVLQGQFSVCLPGGTMFAPTFDTIPGGMLPTFGTIIAGA